MLTVGSSAIAEAQSALTAGSEQLADITGDIIEVDVAEGRFALAGLSTGDYWVDGVVGLCRHEPRHE